MSVEEAREALLGMFGTEDVPFAEATDAIDALITAVRAECASEPLDGRVTPEEAYAKGYEHALADAAALDQKPKSKINYNIVNYDEGDESP